MDSTTATKRVPFPIAMQVLTVLALLATLLGFATVAAGPANASARRCTGVGYNGNYGTECHETNGFGIFINYSEATCTGCTTLPYYSVTFTAELNGERLDTRTARSTAGPNYALRAEWNKGFPDGTLICTEASTGNRICNEVQE